MKSLIILTLLAASNTVSAIHELNHLFREMDKQDPGSYKSGHCPYKPGDIKSKVSNFNFTRMTGIWKVAYDEKELTQNFTCMGARFDEFDSKPADHLSEEENNYLRNNEVKILKLR